MKTKITLRNTIASSLNEELKCLESMGAERIGNVYIEAKEVKQSKITFGADDTRTVYCHDVEIDELAH